MKNYPFPLLILSVALGMTACSKSTAKPAASDQLGVEEAVSIATDAYIYGYPLVTMDMTRRQLTNVDTPDAKHAQFRPIFQKRTT